MEAKALRFEAASVAQEMHKGQKYGDRDYFTAHILAVASMVDHLGGDEIDCAIAYLHDVLEDTKYGVYELRRVFGDEIWRSVIALTKVDGEKYEDYMLVLKLNKRALLVKQADTMCNLIESMKAGNQKRIDKYTRQLAILNEVEVL